MTKAEWQEHFKSAHGTLEAWKRDRAACVECAKRRTTKARNARARERADVMRSLGMTKTAYGWE